MNISHCVYVCCTSQMIISAVLSIGAMCCKKVNKCQKWMSDLNFGICWIGAAWLSQRQHQLMMITVSLYNLTKGTEAFSTTYKQLVGWFSAAPVLDTVPWGLRCKLVGTTKQVFWHQPSPSPPSYTLPFRRLLNIVNTMSVLLVQKWHRRIHFVAV